MVAVLLESGFQRIAVFNRHLHRAEAVVAHFDRAARETDLRALPWHETIIESELSRARAGGQRIRRGRRRGREPAPR